MINNNRPKEYENFDDFLADEIAKDPTLPGRIKKAEQQIHGAFKPDQSKHVWVNQLSQKWQNCANCDAIKSIHGNKPCTGVRAKVVLRGAEPNQPRDCPRCHGTGKNGEDSVLGYPGNPCYYCGGTGVRPDMSNVEPSVPAEVSLCSVCQGMTHTIGGNCGKCGCLKPSVPADAEGASSISGLPDQLAGVPEPIRRIVTAFQLSTDELKLWQYERIVEAIARSTQQAVVVALEELKKQPIKGQISLEGVGTIKAGYYRDGFNEADLVWVNNVDAAIARTKAGDTNHE